MKKLVVAFWVMLASACEASSSGDVFAKMFFTAYREGRCYENSMQLTKALLEDDSEDKLFLVKLQNKGIGTFGLVNAERARAFVKGKIIAEEKNWYEHWFVLDGTGTVFDFDFSEAPTPIALRDYVEEMFLHESECVTPSWTELCGGREDKLNDYWVSIFDARERIEGEKTEVWSGTLKSVIEKRF